MTDEDKELIAGYMGWDIVTVGPKKRPYKIYVDSKDCNIHHEFDPNCAGVCVQEMQKRGEDWREFHNFARNLYYTTNRSNLKIDYNFAAWLFIADNFFGAMAAWLMEEKKC